MKPRSNIGTLITFATGVIERLTNKYAIVLWGGTKYVSKNNSHDRLRHITHFVEINRHTNIIIMSVPYQHDLTDRFCVNRKLSIENW